jgi:outer membrane protein OmpU
MNNKMNKLTKISLSALCGSLASVSAANAGDMTVTGGVDMTYMLENSGDGDTNDGTTGNPIGMGSNLTFKGSGELDNGWTFGLTVAMLNNDAYSNTNVTVTMGGLGELDFNQGNSANGIDAFDDKMPTAWEEPWGMGLNTGIKLVSGVGTASNVQYKTPTIAGTTITVALAPDVGSGNVADKGHGVSDDGTGKAMDGTINVNPSLGTEVLSGLNIFAGGSYTEAMNQTGNLNDRYEAVGGLTLDIGPVSLGYAKSGISTGKTVTKTDVDWYKNAMYGVSFNINDDLSISYGNHQSEVGYVSPGTLEAITTEVVSWQVAYTMGGASIRYADSDVDNGAYQTGTAFDKEMRVLSLALAF